MVLELLFIWNPVTTTIEFGHRNFTSISLLKKFVGLDVGLI